MNNPRIIVALDYPERTPALDLTARLDPGLCRVKVGKELFVSAGPALVEELVRRGFDVFLDLKFHDIPNTVAGAVKAAVALGVWMLNVHALGGGAMLRAAREALAESNPAPKLIAVTLLTSMDGQAVREIGLPGLPLDNVLHLSQLARACAMDGVVCSAQEAAAIRARCGPDFCLVTPGIRASSSARDDQHRTSTASDAIAAGAHYLVIGRPVTRAPDPLQALQGFNAEVTAALSQAQ
jgi:orotidine-5'-phosphate decarboxylase